MEDAEPYISRARTGGDLGFPEPKLVEIMPQRQGMMFYNLLLGDRKQREKAVKDLFFLVGMPFGGLQARRILEKGTIFGHARKR